MNGLKHITLSIIAISLLAGPILFGFATPVKAGIADCLAGIVSGKALATISGLTGGIQAVPVNSSAANTINGNTSGQTQGATVTRCIVEPIVTMIARTILDKFTAETVRWINSGFQGDPLYVTNLDGFLADAGDEVIGRFISSLGPIGQILCSPFDLQLRLALSLQYRSPDFYRQVGCRLSDIEQNVQRAFTSAGGKFGKDGWNNWLKITAVPQNNPYGGYLTAVETLDAELAGRHNIELTQASWGKGFLSSKRCAPGADYIDPETDEKRCTNWITETPGTVIENQLSSTLGVQVQKVGLAKDLDAIVDALIGQLINQILGPGGLLASTESRPNGGQSAADRALARTVAQINAANNQILPTGIKPDSQTDEAFCDEFSKGVFSTPKPPPPRTDSTPVYVKTGETFVLKVTNGNYKWTVADYNTVSTFCRNLPNSKFIKTGVGDFNAASDALTKIPDESNQVDEREQIRLNPDAASQSSVYSGVTSGGGIVTYMASRAIDGNTNPSYGQFSATSNTNPAWWQADFGKSEYLKKITIYGSAPGVVLQGGPYGTVINSSIMISDDGVTFNEISCKIAGSERKPCYIKPEDNPYTNESVTVTFEPPVQSRFLRVVRKDGLWLEIGEVLFYRYLAPTVSADTDAQVIIE